MSSSLDNALGARFDGVVELGANDYDTCARKSDGTVWCWGNDTYRQLADGTDVSHHAPRQVLGVHDVVELAVGALGSCARTADGHAVCWGGNTYGTLGDGTTIARTTAVPVKGLEGVAELAVASPHSCARLVDGTVRCWGSTSWDLGQTKPEPTPVPLTELAGVTQLA
ncbi:MAG: RCC1 repeat-containing protein, partial [Polyangiales bacterium]